MESKMSMVNLDKRGAALVSVVYYQGIPVYAIHLLEENEIITVFASEDGRWQEDGKGMTVQSERLGAQLEQLL